MATEERRGSRLGAEPAGHSAGASVFVCTQAELLGLVLCRTGRSGFAPPYSLRER